MRRSSLLLAALLFCAVACKQPKAVFEVNMASGFDSFHAPWSGLDDDTRFRCFSDEESFNFVYFVNDTTITLKEPFTGEDDVNPEDRIEIFFSPSLSMEKYYCAEIDPLGRIMDYSSNNKREFDFSWNFKTLRTVGQLTDTGYIVEGRIEKSELVELGVDLNGFWMGVFRDDFADFHEPIWYSVVPTDDEFPNFHQSAVLFYAKIK